jgi:peptidoglycan/xylan/chitin deacetylase (PgdA/CDA1 family)
MLTITINSNFKSEKYYILSVLLGEFLGLEYQVNITDTDQILISNGDSKQLSIFEHFFTVSKEQWLKQSSLPVQPLSLWNIKSAGLRATTVNDLIPVIYGGNPVEPQFFEQSEDIIHLGLDIFGSSFFMLTRYEEVVKTDRDQIDRFPASASLAYQENFLDRPIVNEYLEILWSCLQWLWPSLQRKQHQFQTYVSHDLDEPFLYAGTGIPRLLQRCGGDIVRRRSIVEMGKTLHGWYQVNRGKPELDPYNTFDLIIDINEANNLNSAFYFITDHTAGSIDGFYHLDQPLIRELLRKIHDRGHEIGLHTSYNTYQDQAQTKKEFDRLQKACQEEGIQQEQWGGRQHCLRWQASTTFQNWEHAGLHYDSTLTYPEQIGFRCGTCYEYSVYDVLNSKHLHLQERPLTIMEVSVIREAYMGLDIKDGSALSAMKIIKERCRLFKGLFTLLWHNTGFLYPHHVELYRQIVCC